MYVYSKLVVEIRYKIIEEQEQRLKNTENSP